LTALLVAASPLCATPVKIHGYITNFSSVRSFDIDDYRITRDDSLAFDLDKGDYPDATFRPEDLRVGTELEVQGEFNDATHELHATAIKVFFNDNVRVRSSAVVEHGTTLNRDGYGWKGVIRADGQTIRIDGQTKFALKEYQTNLITPGLSISYEGNRQRDGSIVATKLEIFPNVAGGAEQKMLREIAPKLNSSGEIVIRGMRYKLVPDAEAQSYVQRIGAKLVPAFFQRDLSGGAARRPIFQFYLIENPDFNAHAFPNGTVLVNSGVLRVLTSEAQLAAVLGHEIAHATQEHAVREMQHQKKSVVTAIREHGYAGNKGGDPLSNDYSKSLENQADRIGLEYMVSAGYDPREAAQVWKQVAQATGNQKGTVLWSGQDDITARRSYLISEVRNNYAGINFQSYTRNREEFVTLAERFGNTAVAQRPASDSSDSEAKAPAVEVADSVRPGYVEIRPRSPLAYGNSTNQAQATRYDANFVTVISDPAGSNVLVNGRIIGKTPLDLQTGNVGMPYTITVQKSGYRDWTGQLVSVPGRTNLRVDLFPLSPTR
jgi:hypothetical protein